MTSHVIILNPTSGRGRGGSARERLLTALQGHPEWSIIETQSAGHAEILAREAAESGAKVVAAGGGDGTLSDVMNGLMAAGAKATLGVLPLGTGNDFARCIGLGTNFDLAVKTLILGEAKSIDIGRIELNGKSRYFLNICGTGFDALCAQRVDAGRSHPILRRVKGMPAYLLAVLAELRTLQAANLTYDLDGIHIEERALLGAIANSTSYGGGMLVAPDASLHDALFDICTIKDATRLEFLRAFPGVFKGQHIHHPKVEMRRCAELTLTAEPPLPILVDGDVLGTTPAHFTMLPNVLPVLFPIMSRQNEPAKPCVAIP